jgi:hypothetical protein
MLDSECGMSENGDGMLQNIAGGSSREIASPVSCGMLDSECGMSENGDGMLQNIAALAGAVNCGMVDSGCGMSQTGNGASQGIAALAGGFGGNCNRPGTRTRPDGTAKME